jgi:uncharacterized MAPEG superfamily protein
MRMAFELQMIAAGALIGLVNILWLVGLTVPKFGMSWAMGSREDPVAMDGMIGRVQRSLTNFGETFPIFVGAVAVAYLGGRLGQLSSYGALAYVIGRAFYLPIYAFGVPVLRTVAWMLSLAGILSILTSLVV